LCRKDYVLREQVIQFMVGMGGYAVEDISQVRFGIK
ncbi:MAG: hypothetical protein XE04_1924, partial [Marinimicrobia bacterium 46_43]